MLSFPRIIFLENVVGKNLGSHVNILVEANFGKVEEKLREEVRIAYFNQEIREFDVMITTAANLGLPSKFTATAIVQLANQKWVKSISTKNVVRMC